MKLIKLGLPSLLISIMSFFISVHITQAQDPVPSKERVGTVARISGEHDLSNELIEHFFTANPNSLQLHWNREELGCGNDWETETRGKIEKISDFKEQHAIDTLILLNAAPNGKLFDDDGNFREEACRENEWDNFTLDVLTKLQNEYDDIVYLEVIGEPNLPFVMRECNQNGWCEDISAAVARYMGYLQTASIQADQVDPSRTKFKFIVGNTANVPSDWLPEFRNALNGPEYANLRARIAGVGIHPYQNGCQNFTCGNPENWITSTLDPGVLIAEVEYVHNLFPQYSIWVEEIGWSSMNGGQPAEEGQARVLPKTLAVLLSYPEIARVSWFKGRDNSPSEDTSCLDSELPEVCAREGNFGLLDWDNGNPNEDFRKKPAFYAMRQWNELLGDSHFEQTFSSYARNVLRDHGIYLYPFFNDANNARTIVAWAENPTFDAGLETLVPNKVCVKSCPPGVGGKCLYLAMSPDEAKLYWLMTDESTEGKITDLQASPDHPYTIFVKIDDLVNGPVYIQGAIDMNVPEIQINYPGHGDIYSKPGDFVGGTNIGVNSSIATISYIDEVSFTAYYKTQNDAPPSSHSIASAASDETMENFYFEWDVADIPDQVGFEENGDNHIILEIYARNAEGRETRKQIAIGLIRTLGAGMGEHQQKFIDAYKQANESSIKPGLPINLNGVKTPYWWPSASASYRVVRQDFENGSLIYDQCGLQKNGDFFECPGQGNETPAARAYFVPVEIMQNYEVFKTTLGGPIAEFFIAERSSVGRSTGIGMRFGADGGNRSEIWYGDVYYDNRKRTAHEVHGPILTDYHAAGGTGGSYGFPRSNVEVHENGNKFSRFEAGVIYWNDPVSPGDCNADQTVDAADITSLVSVIFQNNAGSDGCDANRDNQVDVADITCATQIYFSGAENCGGHSVE